MTAGPFSFKFRVLIYAVRPNWYKKYSFLLFFSRLKTNSSQVVFLSVRSTRISARRTPSGSREPGRCVVVFLLLLGFRVHGFSALSLA